ncbi:MAG: hypothetical protein LBK76_09455 [Verrucomicrobiales bacterium]|jgi:hypothetical protein|nr:hypothetical protein [Verrucomicrobiales bacterium]
MDLPLLTLTNSLLFFIFIVAGIQFIITIILAVVVFKDARDRKAAGEELFLLDPILWGIITFVTGAYVAVLVYWLIHYSVLRSRRD